MIPATLNGDGRNQRCRTFCQLVEMLRHGIGFWSTLAAYCMLTLILYLATIWTLGKSETTL